MMARPIQDPFTSLEAMRAPHDGPPWYIRVNTLVPSSLLAWILDLQLLMRLLTGILAKSVEVHLHLFALRQCSQSECLNSNQQHVIGLGSGLGCCSTEHASKEVQREEEKWEKYKEEAPHLF
jgi:hypothetical protein